MQIFQKIDALFSVHFKKPTWHVLKKTICEILFKFFKKHKFFFIFFKQKNKLNFGLARSETSTRCRSGNGFLGLANIWSRLMKHNWWNLLYRRVRIHSDVFLTLHSMKIHFYTTISIVRRSNFSPCMRMISNHDFYFIVVNRFFFFWTAENKSYWNHHQLILKKIVTSPKLKKNQNTIEKNKFYEWKIWRIIIKTMNENNFICIKINSWFHRVSSAFFFHKRLFFYHHHFNSWPLSNLIWSNETLSAFISIIESIQINISTADFFFDQMRIPPALLFIIGSYRSIFSTADFFLIKWRLR